MSPNSEPAREERKPEPRWPALIAVLAVGGLYLALQSDLVIGPRWLFPATITALLVPTTISHQTGRHDLNRILGLAISALVTIGLIVSMTLLIRYCTLRVRPTGAYTSVCKEYA